MKAIRNNYRWSDLCNNRSFQRNSRKYYLVSLIIVKVEKLSKRAIFYPVRTTDTAMDVDKVFSDRVFSVHKVPVKSLLVEKQITDLILRGHLSSYLT